MWSLDGMQAMQDGMPLLPQLYASSDMSDFHDILAQRASVVVRQVQHNLPQIQWLATAIERERVRLSSHKLGRTDSCSITSNTILNVDVAAFCPLVQPV